MRELESGFVLPIYEGAADLIEHKLHEIKYEFGLSAVSKRCSKSFLLRLDVDEKDWIILVQELGLVAGLVLALNLVVIHDLVRDLKKGGMHAVLNSQECFVFVLGFNESCEHRLCAFLHLYFEQGAELKMVTHKH